MPGSWSSLLGHKTLHSIPRLNRGPHLGISHKPLAPDISHIQTPLVTGKRHEKGHRGKSVPSKDAIPAGGGVAD